MIQEATSMRSALQTASANEKLLITKEEEIKTVRAELEEAITHRAVAETLRAKTVELEEKVVTFEAEIASVSLPCFSWQRVTG